MAFKILSSEYILQHRYFTARRDSYQTPAGKVVEPYFVVELPVSVCAMGVTANNEVIMVEQYRHPVQQKLVELPGGFIDEGEKPEVAIMREFLEETGYSFPDAYFLGETAANPGVLSNFTQLFLLTGGIKTGVQSLDPNEEIDIQVKPLEEVRQMLLRNEIKQSMHALCLFLGFEKLRSLQQ